MKHLHFDLVDSTRALAKRHLEQRPEISEPLLVSASQAGIEQCDDGKTFAAPQGGAWFTAATPVSPDAAIANIAPLLAGYSVIRTLRRLLSRSTDGQRCELSIKWPNDVLLNNRKVARVVCEQWFSPGAKSQWLLTRIEVNANMSRDALETNDQTVTTVRDETGISIDIDALIVETAEDFIQLLSHAGSNGALCHGVLRAIESRLAWIDEPVAVATGGWQVCGLVHGLDESGRLQIRTADGIHLLASGDLKQLHSADRLGVWQGFPQGPAERHTFARD